MKPLPPEVSLGQLLDIIHGKKPKPVPRRVMKVLKEHGRRSGLSNLLEHME